MLSVVTFTRQLVTFVIKRSRLKLLFFLLLMLEMTPSEAQEWHGITPLKSSRSEVEQILGPAKTNTANTSLYIFHEEKVFIVFSKGSCYTNPDGWNVSKDIVITITVSPNSKTKFNTLRLKERGYKEKPDDEVRNIVYYTNEGEGNSYEVDIQEGIIKSITYFPKFKDNYLRCSGPNEGLVRTYKFDEYSEISPGEEKKRLDNFVKLLLRYDTTDAFVIVYAGRNSTEGEAKARGQKINDYLLNEPKLDARRIRIIDGGYREKPFIELYLVPPGAPQPMATPTVDPKVCVSSSPAARGLEQHSDGMLGSPGRAERVVLQKISIYTRY